MKDTIYLYLFNDYADWEIGYLIGEIGRKEMFRSDVTPPQLVMVAKTKDPIKSLGGLTVLPDVTLDEIDFDKALGLILPGGDSWLEQGEHDEVLEVAQQLLDQEKAVGAICAATAAIVKNGVVGDRRHTSNDLGWLKYVIPDYEEVNYQVSPAVLDDHLITANGTAPLEFAAKVFEELDLSTPAIIESWLRMNKTSEAKDFYEYIEAVENA